MTKLGEGLSVGGLITFGTTTSLLAKIVYEIQSTGSDGTVKYFRKPWAMTSVMFLGMSFCLPLAYYEEAQRKRKQRAAAGPGGDAEVPLLPPQEQPHHHKPRSELREVLMLSVPTAFDLLATVLMNVGLLYVTASVYQMMRGAEMIFAAVFAVTFLKRHLNKFHYLGILCCMAGISMVGMASVLSGEGSATQVVTTEQMLTGMALIIISQAVQVGLGALGGRVCVCVCVCGTGVGVGEGKRHAACGMLRPRPRRRAHTSSAPRRGGHMDTRVRLLAAGWLCSAGVGGEGERGRAPVCVMGDEGGVRGLRQSPGRPAASFGQRPGYGAVPRAGGPLLPRVHHEPGHATGSGASCAVPPSFGTL